MFALLANFYSSITILFSLFFLNPPSDVSQPDHKFMYVTENSCFPVSRRSPLAT